MDICGLNANRLVRFDGVRFVPWIPPDGQHLRPRMSFSFGRARWEFMDRDGGGLSRWDKRDLTSYLIEPTRINSIIEMHGTVSFVRSRGSAEAGGLCQIIAQACGAMERADGLPGSNVATALVEDGLGNLWTAAIQRCPLETRHIHYVQPKGLKSFQGLTAYKAWLPTRWLSLGWNDFRWPGSGLQQLVQGAGSHFATPEFDAVPWKFKRFLRSRKRSLDWDSQTGHLPHSCGKVNHFRSADGLSAMPCTGSMRM